MFSLWPITEHKTHERGGSTAKKESKCLNSWAQILLRFLIFKLVRNNSIYLQNYQEHFQTETLGATAPSTCSRYPLGLWFLKTYPRSTRKTFTHIPLPAGLEAVILWLGQKDLLGHDDWGFMTQLMSVSQQESVLHVVTLWNNGH